MTSGRLYAYCVVSTDSAPAVGGDRLVEPHDGDLRVLTFDGIGVLVSGLGDEALRMTAHNLDAHDVVVEAALQQGTVLPLRFGTVFDSLPELESFVSTNRTGLVELLERFNDCIEMRVVASYAGDSAVREAFAGNPHIRRLKAKVDRLPPAAAYYERIALGEEVAKTVALLRANDSESLASRLRPLVLEAHRLSEGDDSTFLRAAFLMRRGDRAEFERALEAVAAEQEGRAEVRVIGPLAPWDFVEMASHSERGSPPRRGSRRRRESAWAS